MKQQVRGLGTAVVIGVSSRFFGSKFPQGPLDVPRSFRNPHGMNEEGRQRAGQAIADALAARGWNAIDLADAADIGDPSTVRSFIAGTSYPQTKTRGRIESALGLDAGIIDRIAKGAAYTPGLDQNLDPVEAAIEAAPRLTRRQKLKLLGDYLDMIEAGEGSSSSIATGA